ncbi:DoxX family protein [Archangium violaceum]|uniref:DoxX family protein n=1 Tax=Archangium violaceum TaxID=83451 RepID=UPI0036DE5CE3
MGGRPGPACSPRGCAASPPAWRTARAAPVRGPPRPLRSSPHPQHALYPAYTPRERLEDLGKLLLRLLVGGLMLFHGIDKLLHGPGDVAHDLAEHGLPTLMAYGVYVGEVVAPVFILVGAWTRLWALVYGFNVLFAVLLVHAHDFGRLAPTGGWAAELYVFYVVGAFVVALLGSGRCALRRGVGRWD